MTGVTCEEISDAFDIFGEDVDNDQLSKLRELCLSYDIDANGLVNNWMAFSSTRKVDLTIENILIFDREWLQKKLSGLHNKNQKPKNNVSLNNGTVDSISDDQIEIIGTYATPEQKKHLLQVKRQLTPEDVTNSNKRFVGLNRSPTVTAAYSPKVMTPAGSTPSSKFSSRSNSGDVVQTFGSMNDFSWQGEVQMVKITPFSSEVTLDSNTKYMFQKMHEKASVLNDIIQDMSTLLQNAHGIEELSHVALPSQESVTVAGRICCDSIGRLNNQSVLLEGSHETSSGKCISLDLSEVTNYSLFPGQILTCEGVNNTGKKLVVQKIYPTVPLPFSEFTNKHCSGKLRIYIAVGPYTPSDVLDYSPLSELMKKIVQDKPDLCILMGPFVDIKHVLINSGELLDTFQELFIKQMEEIGRATQGLGTKIVIVPSCRDAHHFFSVYPQPGFSIPEYNANGSKRSHAELELTKHLNFVSDPCTLSVNNIVIGLTSTDILMHLTKSEISLGQMGKMDRIGRLTQHVLHQHSYYPLYPPLEDVNLDYELYDAHGKLPITPHLLILPSDLKAFIKNIDGCCCINPGRLTTGTVGGTFAQICINTDMLPDKIQPAEACSGQIVRV
ncbi:DNA polymerase alpha subunit B [Biomphalaria glabrata]|nr:DNA polymerase alpha subunit B-like [Biomphalaria glabrata]KAI8788317.1 DNA polymerase alpha subunit B [Biomphalaria glabrata]